MSDSITSCTAYKNPDGSIQYYEVGFSFDGVTVSSKCNPLYISAHTLTDPNDLVEVKAVACRQASAIKDLYVNAVSISSLNGPVTL